MLRVKERQGVMMAVAAVEATTVAEAARLMQDPEREALGM
jgi:hypothetical protein